MIGHYLSNNNEMCYSTKTQTFSRTKHSLVDQYGYHYLHPSLSETLYAYLAKD